MILKYNNYIMILKYNNIYDIAVSVVGRLVLLLHLPRERDTLLYIMQL